jgi:hypothetical protein
VAGDTLKLLETPESNDIRKKRINNTMSKTCYKCNKNCPLADFKYGKSHCYDCQKEMSRNWKARNKVKVAEYNKVYKSDNKEEISTYNHHYNKDNRETIQKRQTANYYKYGYNENENYKIARNMRKRFRDLLQKNDVEKDTSALTILGCSLDTFKTWLSSCFEERMTFKNYGEVWHMDHVVPCALFDLTVEQERLKCFHWTNIKPMFAIENLKKNARLYEKEIDNHENKLQNFLNSLVDKTHYTLIDIDRKSYIKNTRTV